MTKFIASLVLASTLIGSIGAAQAAPKAQNEVATSFFVDLARNGN
jgi:nitrous oxide reductase accessory protein NosL